MPVLNLQVSQGIDDANELNNNTSFSNSDATCSLQASATSSLRRNAGFRFQNVTIPHGATITRAWLQFRCTSGASDDPNLVIFCEAADNSQDFSANQHVTNVANRPRTSASVSWVASNINATFTNQQQNTPDLSAIIQEVTDRGSWASGNALTFLLIPNATNSPTCIVEMYDGASADAARLHVEWVTGSQPTYASTTVTDFGSDATSHAANCPATVNSGDLLLAIAAFDDSCTITTPSGWTKICGDGTDYGTIALMDIGVYARKADGTEGGTTVGFTTSNAQRGSVHIVRYTSWAGNVDALVAMITNVDATSTYHINLTAAGGDHDCDVVLAQVKSTTATWASGGGTPTGYSNDNRTGVGEDLISSASIASATKHTIERFDFEGNNWLTSDSGSLMVAVLIPGSGQGENFVGLTPSASPSWISTTVTDFGADATTHTANYPASGVTAGDLFVYIAAFDGDRCYITTPSGLTKLIGDDYTFYDIAASQMVGVYLKIADGSEGGSTVGFSTPNSSQRGSVHILQLRAWSGSLDSIAAMLGAVNSSGKQSFGVGGTAENRLLIAAECKSTTNTWAAGAGTPSGYSNDNRTGTGEDTSASASIASATKAANSAAEDIGTPWRNPAASTPMFFIVSVPGVAGQPAAGRFRVMQMRGGAFKWPGNEGRVDRWIKRWIPRRLAPAYQEEWRAA